MSWSNREFTFFNQPSPINLGLALSQIPMSVQPGEGDAIINSPGTSPASGTFDAIFRSNTPGLLDLTLEGNYVCPATAFECYPVPGNPSYPYWRSNFVTTVATISGGTLVGAGPGQLPTELNGAPITYSVDWGSPVSHLWQPNQLRWGRHTSTLSRESALGLEEARVDSTGLRRPVRPHRTDTPAD